MESAAQKAIPRRIGTILVERRMITEAQLALALKEQQAKGRPLGEICVERFGLDRLNLADALAMQWDEMQRAASFEAEDLPSKASEHTAEEDGPAGSPDEDELRVLLAEAQAARDELTVKTDELSRRLAALETLVVGVSAAIAELRPAGGEPAPKRSHRPAAPVTP